MRKALTMMTMLLLILTASAGAFNYQLGYDFGNPFDENNNYSPVDYPYHIHHVPSPGWTGEGGEKFDLEGIHFAVSGDMIHIALTNSFGLGAYSTAWHQTYNLGDIFFGFGSSNTSYAINPFTGNLYAVGSYQGIPNMPGSYYDHPAIRSAVGAYRTTSGSLLGTADMANTLWRGLETNPMMGSGDTYVLEFAFNRGLIDMAGAKNINFHNTLACGNDLMEKSFTIVPEPTTLLLFGLGLFGMGALRKKD